MTYIEELQKEWPTLDIQKRYPTLCNHPYHKVHTLGDAINELRRGYSNLGVMFNLDAVEKSAKAAE